MDEESMWKGFYEKLQQQKSVEEQVHDSRYVNNETETIIG